MRLSRCSCTPRRFLGLLLVLDILRNRGKTPLPDSFSTQTLRRAVLVPDLGYLDTVEAQVNFRGE